MADLEQELAQLLDDAPEEDEDEEEDERPLVPRPDTKGVEAPAFEPFDSDPEGLGGSGYDSWGPKIDLSAEVPPEPSGLDPEQVKAALTPPGVAKPEQVTVDSESDARPDSNAPSDEGSGGGDGQASSHDAEGEDDDEPESDVPDTKPSAVHAVPIRRRSSSARQKASPASDAKGAFTPLRAVLVALGVLAFLWLIRRPVNPSKSVPEQPAAESTSELLEREQAAPTDETVTAEPLGAPNEQVDAAGDETAPSDSATAEPTLPDPSLLAGDGPLPFDRVSVVSALGPFAIEASRCRRKPDPAGRVLVNLVIAPTGHIKSIATGPRHSGTKTEECILEKLRRAKLDPHAGGDQTVALPVQLK
jgi:hypothetical protein